MEFLLQFIVESYYFLLHINIGDWKTASAHFKSMLATERFIVEVDDMTREQVSIVFENRISINKALVDFVIIFSSILFLLNYVTDK